jgi:hypothetical protein
MAAIAQPTIAFTPAQTSSDGGAQCYDVVLDTGTLAALYHSKKLYVIEDEQRGDDPVSGKEMLSEDKIERWTQQELAGQFRVGQLTFCSRAETGGKIEFDGSTATVFGDLVLADSRQRVYTLIKCEEGKAKGNGYVSRDVSARIYPETTPDSRRSLFYDYNQEGSKADESRSKLLAPKGSAQRVARHLVENNAHLTHGNVNTVRNRITSKDHRLAGFNTFAMAVEAAWDRVLMTDDDVNKIGNYLVGFWDRLVEVLSDLDIKTVPERGQIRKDSLVGNAVTIYGYLAVARALYGENGEGVDLSVLDQLKDPAWFDINADHWKQVGVVVPSRDRDGDVTGYRVAMSFQTRAAMTAAMLEKMGYKQDKKTGIIALVSAA